jgi:hypothetical protein
MAQAADDFDYSGLHSEEMKTSVVSQKQEKKTGLSARKSIAQRAAEQPAGVDLAGLADSAAALNQAAPKLEVPEKVSDWQNYLGLGTGALATMATIYNLLQNKNIKSKLEEMAAKETKPDMREEVFKKPPIESSPIQQAQQTLANIQAARSVPQPSAQPTATPTTTYNQPLAQVPGMPPQVTPTQAPVAPVQPPVQAAAPVAPVAPVEAPAPVVEAAAPETKIATRVRRTNAQIAAEKAALEAAAPPGFHPTYKKGTGQMGPGAYNWLYGQEGSKAPGIWKELFGERNIPFSNDPTSELQSKYLNYKQSVAEPGVGLNELPRGAGGGQNKAPKYVPEYIKGAVSPAALLNLAGNALGGIGLAQAYQEGKKTGDYSNLGLGAIGQILGNIAPRASLGFSLMAPSETNKGEKEELAKRRKKQPTID